MAAGRARESRSLPLDGGAGALPLHPFKPLAGGGDPKWRGACRVLAAGAVAEVQRVKTTRGKAPPGYTALRAQAEPEGPAWWEPAFLRLRCDRGCDP